MMFLGLKGMGNLTGSSVNNIQHHHHHRLSSSPAIYQMPSDMGHPSYFSIYLSLFGGGRIRRWPAPPKINLFPMLIDYSYRHLTNLNKAYVEEQGIFCNVHPRNPNIHKVNKISRQKDFALNFSLSNFSPDYQSQSEALSGFRRRRRRTENKPLCAVLCSCHHDYSIADR